MRLIDVATITPALVIFRAIFRRTGTSRHTTTKLLAASWF
jgi:hypothetical protein